MRAETQFGGHLECICPLIANVTVKSVTALCYLCNKLWKIASLLH